MDAHDVPVGFGMALAQNLDAMDYFASLSPDQQAMVVEHTRRISSKNEMHAFVRELAQGHLLD